MKRRRLTAVDRSELLGVDAAVLVDLARHADLANAHYRAAAEAIGRLYISADTHRLGALTRSLDEPMHHAADVERTFASLLHDLQACIAPRAREP